MSTSEVGKYLHQSRVLLFGCNNILGRDYISRIGNTSQLYISVFLYLTVLQALAYQYHSNAALDVGNAPKCHVSKSTTRMRTHTSSSWRRSRVC